MTGWTWSMLIESLNNIQIRYKLDVYSSFNNRIIIPLFHLQWKPIFIDVLCNCLLDMCMYWFWSTIQYIMEMFLPLIFICFNCIYNKALPFTDVHHYVRNNWNERLCLNTYLVFFRIEFDQCVSTIWQTLFVWVLTF